MRAQSTPYQDISRLLPKFEIIKQRVIIFVEKCHRHGVALTFLCLRHQNQAYFGFVLYKLVLAVKHHRQFTVNQGAHKWHMLCRIHEIACCVMRNFYWRLLNYQHHACIRILTWTFSGASLNLDREIPAIRANHDVGGGETRIQWPLDAV